MKRGAWWLAGMALIVVAQAIRPDADWAYIGPGAGFAFIGSLLTVLTGFILTLFSLVSLPFRICWRLIRRRAGFRNARIRKLIFLGLDGLDPTLVETWIGEGKLPNLARLRREGGYRRLRTTFPAMSPVAWSTFATGVNPGKHNIFDFLNRNLKSYVPELSSARVRKPDRLIRIGKWSIPFSGPKVEMRRKSRTFWSLLGEQGIGSTILRVPITFPPESFRGRLLSAMCVPDLKGTQGTFTLFTTRVSNKCYESGSRSQLGRVGEFLEGVIEGPENFLVRHARPIELPVRLLVQDAKHATLEVEGERYPIERGKYTGWIRMTFRALPGVSVTGLARFLATELSPECSVYMTPLEIDPEHPALPISHPPFYAAYLAKQIGPYATLGFAEDTWALNEGVIDEDAFLDQAYSAMAEREAMLDAALAKTRRGVVACVFDTTDRVQHMFYRYLDPRGNRGTDSKNATAIERAYREMDRIVGKTMECLDSETVLFVLSDHGFCGFRRGVNLNSWLVQNGYMTLLASCDQGGRWLQNVDWTRTRVYSLGLAGLYFNLAGREKLGIVRPVDAEALGQELIGKLTGLPDPETGEVAIRTVYSVRELYHGPYVDDAPDLIIGYQEGYRTSWDAAVGRAGARVFEDNVKPWSGDHCVDPELVPGVLFCSRPIDAEQPGIEDLAPTALDLFGLTPPQWMDGQTVFRFSGQGCRA